MAMLWSFARLIVQVAVEQGALDRIYVCDGFQEMGLPVLLSQDFTCWNIGLIDVGHFSQYSLTPMSCLMAASGNLIGPICWVILQEQIALKQRNEEFKPRF